MLKDSNKFLRLMSILLFVFVIANFLTGCFSSDTETKNPSVKDIGDSIKESVDFSNMVELDEDRFERIYGVDLNKIEDFFIYVPSSNISASEVAVIKVKDSSDVDYIKDKINMRVEKQAKSFKDYLPEEYYLIDNHILKSKGDYILFVISEDADKIEEIFDNSFK